MIDRLRVSRRLATGAVFLTTAFFLSGCLDVDYDVTLHNDGSGSIVTKIVYDKQMSSYLAKNKAKTQKDSKIFKNGKPVPRTAKMKDGRLTEEQVVNFASLSDLTLPENGIQVTDLGRSFLGVDTSRIHVAFGKPGGHKASKHDSDGPEARKMIAEIMKDHYLTVTMHLPCNIHSANTLSIADATVKPDVESSWLHGSVVKWKIPMEAVFASGEKDAPQFDIVCRSFMGIPEGKTKG